MKTRTIFLITVLAVMFGGTSAIGLAQETTETDTPEANTAFVATVDDETNYINYYVCSLNEDAEDYCDTTLDDFDASTFEDWTGEIEVTLNEEGELNHGSYVSAFADGYEGDGKGCLMRFVAQSNWGKPGTDIESYDVLEQAEIHCAFNRNGDAEVTEEDDEGSGKPAWAGNGKPPWAGPDGNKSLRPDKDEDSDG